MIYSQDAAATATPDRTGKVLMTREASIHPESKSARDTWCDLNVALSELTQQKLVRTTTLIQGAERCDYRVLPAD